MSLQRLLLEKYAREKGFTNTRFIYDDGYSGTNFRRPGWEELMELVESEQVATIIVKDMSRLGREYLQVGQYTEIFFQQKNVRFIAINNSIDSDHPNDNDFAPFLNLINNRLHISTVSRKHLKSHYIQDFELFHSSRKKSACSCFATRAAATSGFYFRV